MRNITKDPGVRLYNRMIEAAKAAEEAEQKEEHDIDGIVFGIPDWLLEKLNLPNTTQRIVLVASNQSFMHVNADYYPRGGTA